MDDKPSKPDPSTDITITPDLPTVTPDIPATPPKTPRYKQCYRSEWESMPDFKGWLRGVPNEPTRAYCTYCDKSLHAHRLSLLKHTCTLKHTKAAQSAFSMQKMAQKGQTPDGKVSPQKPSNHSNANEMPHEDEDEEAVDDVDPLDDGASGDSNAAAKPPPNKIAKMDVAAPPPPPLPPVPVSPLSTHVLDTAKGNPVGGLQVTLYKLIEGRWTLIHEGFTNPDGRYTEFIERASFVAGRYKLHFDVDRYFELRRQETLYPFIEIVFDVKSPQDHYHIPLLLSPFGYTTYRGS
ncbi:uncharacterized protein [Anabrus simplex]|uniref:uncharacterized protein n=1 Tax=Anabrus simplex TaxID=316456 RepID=UPI0035A344AA